MGQLQFFAAPCARGVVDARSTGVAGPWPTPRPDLRRRHVAVGPVAVFGASNFPARVLCGRWRHGGGAGGGLSGCRQGSPGASSAPASWSRGRSARPCSAAACRRVSSLSCRARRMCWAVRWSRTAHTGRRLHRIARGGPCPYPPRCRAPAADSCICRDVERESRILSSRRGASRAHRSSHGLTCPHSRWGPASSAPTRDCSWPSTMRAWMPSWMSRLQRWRRPLRTYAHGGSPHPLRAGYPGAPESHRAWELLAHGRARRAQTAARPRYWRRAFVLLRGSGPRRGVFGPSSLVLRAESTGAFARLATAPGRAAHRHGALRGRRAGRGRVAAGPDAAGRSVIGNGWPTGVEVARAMVHGGPFPSTIDGRSSSVGALAIQRFVRPICFQNLPDTLLPPALRSDNPCGIPRRLDGATIPGRLVP